MGGVPLHESILESENIDFLFEVKQKESEESVTKDISPVSEEIPNKEKKPVYLSLEEKILDLLSKQRLPIKEIAAMVDEDEKVVKKSINKMVKAGEVQKHPNRPLQFSKIMKLPGMELL